MLGLAAERSRGAGDMSHDLGERDRAEDDQRPNREIDPGGHDHERHAAGQYDDLRRVERDVEQVGGAEKAATRSEHCKAEEKRAENHDEEGALALDQPLQQPNRHRSTDTVGGGSLRHVPASAAPCAVPPELSWYSSSPVIARSSASVSTAPIGAVRTARPRRITVTRSATSKTCASVWEMKITPRFESRR